MTRQLQDRHYELWSRASAFVELSLNDDVSEAVYWMRARTLSVGARPLAGKGLGRPRMAKCS